MSTLTFCASFVPPVGKCNNVRGHRSARASVHFITKSGAASLPQKVQDVNDLRRHQCLEFHRALLTMALISGTDVSMPAFELHVHDDNYNIHRDIN